MPEQNPIAEMLSEMPDEFFILGLKEVIKDLVLQDMPSMGDVLLAAMLREACIRIESRNLDSKSAGIKNG